MRNVAEIVGLICFVVFAYFVWAPLALGVAGLILFAGAHSNKRYDEQMGRAVYRTPHHREDVE